MVPMLTVAHWILTASLGFHATTPTEFAEGFAKALSLSPEDALAMRLRARKSAKRFSEEVFATAWVGQMEKLVALQESMRPKS